MTPIDPATVLALLESTPSRIDLATLGLSGKDLTWKPSPDSWSVNEVIAHLRACADVWGDSILKILKRGQSDLPVRFSPHLDTEDNLSKFGFPDFLSRVQEAARGLLKILQPPDREGWSRRAIVKATKLREETVLSYAQRLADHEVGHRGQIVRILHARRRE